MEVIVYPFENPFKKEDESVNILEIEKKEYFVRVVNSFYQISQNEDADEVINIFENGKLTQFNKIAKLIINPFEIDLDDKKILFGLHEMIAKDIDFEIEIAEEINHLYQKLLRQVMMTANEYDFDYSYNIMPITKDVLKLLGLKIVFEENLNLQNKIIEYINVIATLNAYKLLVFVNIKNYLNDKELVEIYKYSKYKNIDILLIESQSSNIIEYERKLKIDKEYDEFVELYQKKDYNIDI